MEKPAHSIDRRFGSPIDGEADGPGLAFDRTYESEGDLRAVRGVDLEVGAVGERLHALVDG